MKKKQKRKAKPHVPPGVKLLAYFYFLTALLYLLSTLLFYEILDIEFLGKVLPTAQAILLQAILVLVPLYLCFGLVKLKRGPWACAIFYHSFFIINSILGVVDTFSEKSGIRPMLQVVAKSELKDRGFLFLTRAESVKVGVFSLSIVIGIAFITYLYIKREEFK